MLHPNRLSSRPLARRKTANSRLVRRRPSRYTASYSDRRTRRALRGKSYRGVSDARKTVAPLLAACRKYLPSTLALHSCAKSMLLMAAPHMRLKSAFRQRSLSSAFRSISVCTASHAPGEFRQQFRSLTRMNRALKRNNEFRRPPHSGQGNVARMNQAAGIFLRARVISVARLPIILGRQPCCVYHGPCSRFCSFFPRLQQHRTPTTTPRLKNLASSLFQYPVSPKFSNSSTGVSPCFTPLPMRTPAARFRP
jgi:hypothetical protein